MEDVHESESPSVYHDEEWERNGAEADAALIAELFGDRPPRLFVLVREDDEAPSAALPEVVAYGIQTPDGGTSTLFGGGRGIVLSPEPEAAASRFGADLVWVAR